MAAHLQNYYRYADNVHTYFIEYDDTLLDEIYINGDQFKIKGSETFIPGILLKTITALAYLWKESSEYDYLIRSNSSTIINFVNLIEFIESNPMDYFCANKFLLEKLNPYFGIVDETFFGTPISQGILIGISSKFVKIMLDKRHTFIESLIDDVSISVFLKDNGAHLQRLPWNSYYDKAHELIDDDIPNVIKTINPITWRMKSDNRDEDAYRMELITNSLLQHYSRS